MEPFISIPPASLPNQLILLLSHEIKVPVCSPCTSTEVQLSGPSFSSETSQTSGLLAVVHFYSQPRSLPTESPQSSNAGISHFPSSDLFALSHSNLPKPKLRSHLFPFPKLIMVPILPRKISKLFWLTFKFSTM